MSENLTSSDTDGGARASGPASAKASAKGSAPVSAPISAKGAADRLAAALGLLDAALDPVLARLSRAETQLSETQGFSEDRARMASELDTAKADTEALRSRLDAREEEFAALSRETRQELDATISTLRDVLSGAD